MKRWLILFAVFSVLTVMPCISRADFQKTKIAVLDFQLQGKGYDTADMGKIVAEWLITALVKEGRFDVIERRLLEKVLEEQKLVMTGVVDEQSATKLGKLLGVKIIISGSVMKFQGFMEVNARIIDVESASIITAESVKSSTAVRLEALVVQMAEKIISDFPLEGYVVNKKGNSVTIDLGKRAGVKRGMRFIVYKEGNVIKHPKTGEVLEIENIQTGTLEIEGIRDNIATAKIIQEATPGAISYGQMVKSDVKLDTPIGRYSQPDTLKLPEATGTSDVQLELAKIDPMLEEVRQMKTSGDLNWTIRLKEVFVALKPILGRYPTSPEVYLYYAKAYYLAEKLRKSNKCFEKAVYYNPSYVEAFVLQGDMNHEYGIKIGSEKSRTYKLDVIAATAYEAAARIQADNSFQSMMFFKIGNVYAELSEDYQKARLYWQKAVSANPNGDTARLAGDKLTNISLGSSEQRSGQPVPLKGVFDR